MATTKIARVKGVADFSPEQSDALHQLQTRLLDHLRGYGYQRVGLPVLEHSDLYQRKAGEDIVARLYAFQYRNRRLALRPEMTASAIRAYIEQMQQLPLPVRLAYAGPVFRYERPQKARYRQFTQVGVELIGADGAMADAEIIHTARLGLAKLGVINTRLVVGYLGILTDFLWRVGIEGQLFNFLMLNMEALRKHGMKHLVDQIHQIYPTFNVLQADGVWRFEDPQADLTQRGRMLEMLRDMREDDARLAVLDFLQSLNITLDSNRDPHDIIDGLLAKLRRDDQIPRLNKALRFMSELGQLIGQPETVLDEAERLIRAYDMEPAALLHLRETIALLRAYGLDERRITLDLGLSRGLQYYTGTVFEIFHNTASDEEDRQLCGGGRYDDLIATLGGNSAAAIGFSYGLERIYHALQDEGVITASSLPAPDFLVIALNAEDQPAAIRLAEGLREHGHIVETALRERNLKNNLNYADKRGIPHALIIGPDERDHDRVILRDMARRDEQTLDRAALLDQLETLTHDA